ncbi:MAG TPA: competence/damage-inducible protein A [Desulfobacteria bacterium]|nr:competence/damage-inducible protein A [Desulfobacteria bacterium]
MRAELISTGTEILLGQILNSNAQYLGQRLAGLGIDVYFQTTVGDNGKRIAEVIRAAVNRADLLIVTGGLGPTMDDLTKEAISEFFGLKLMMDDDSLSSIEAFFRDRGKIMPEINKKQALIPEGAVVIPNKRGTAPGVILEHGSTTVVILPGPPIEMQPMFEETVVPYLREKSMGGSDLIVSRVLRILGLGESAVEEKVSDLVLQQSNPTIAFLAPKGEVLIRITAKAESEAAAEKLIAAPEKEIRKRLGSFIYGSDDETLEKAVVRLFKERGLTVSAAESCTGGLIAKRITDIEGASESFMYGIVSYDNQAKINLLGVSPETLDAHGAVSKETALEMVRGVRKACGTDVAVSVTGIAGPGGGTPEKPVGLVYIGFADSDTTAAEKYLFAGDRETIRWQAANTALNKLRLYLLDGNF